MFEYALVLDIGKYCWTLVQIIYIGMKFIGHKIFGKVKKQPSGWSGLSTHLRNSEIKTLWFKN